MAEQWAVLELVETEVGDFRLTKRLIEIVSTLAANPTCSIPEAFDSWSDAKAAYRFLENDDVEPAAILTGHRLSTLRRIGNYRTVLAIQDTTTINFSNLLATKGLGSIGGKRGNMKEDPQGLWVHSCLAASLDGVPLGLLGQKQWVRGASENTPEESDTPDGPESARWIEMAKVSSEGVPPGTKVITVADREADIFGLFAEVLNQNQDAVIRAKHNRHLAGKKDRLWDALERAEVAGTMVATVPKTPEREPRTATLELRTAWVRIPSPKVITPLTLSAVLAREVDPPEGTEPIEWRLLTTLTIVSRDDARTCVEIYTKRWLIERFHYTLKSGCQVEELQLESAARLQRAVSIYSVVAWRLLYLTYMSRVNPAAPCTGLLSDAEWQALFCHFQKTTQLPETPPSLETAIVWIARLGGFLARKHDGKPGVKVIWKGYRRLQDMVTMWEILRPKQ